MLCWVQGWAIQTQALPSRSWHSSGEDKPINSQQPHSGVCGGAVEAGKASWRKGRVGVRWEIVQVKTNGSLRLSAGLRKELGEEVLQPGEKVKTHWKGTQECGHCPWRSLRGHRASAGFPRPLHLCLAASSFGLSLCLCQSLTLRLSHRLSQPLTSSGSLSRLWSSSRDVSKRQGS